MHPTYHANNERLPRCKRFTLGLNPAIACLNDRVIDDREEHVDKQQTLLTTEGED